MYRPVYCINPINEVHLHGVMKTMLNLKHGPLLVTIDMEGYSVLLEGTHRMESARRLGYPVAFLPVGRKDTIYPGDVKGLNISRPWVAKKLAFNLMAKRFKFLTPVYKWSEDSGMVEVVRYPTASLSFVARIVGITSLVWLGLFLISAVSVGLVFK